MFLGGLRYVARALKNGSRAIRCRESCQAGDRAALSGFSDVPRGCLFRARSVTAHVNAYRRAVHGLILYPAIFVDRKNSGTFILRIVGTKANCLITLKGRENMYQALYRKWRPSVFDDVVGQEHITSILRSEIASGRLSHAYLFCGPRGTGKTTCAKIISKAANCEHPVNGDPCGECASCRAIAEGATTDVIEMDAASNNGVDNIRDLRDSIVYTPADLKYRVYIIDEVHMLSTSAFNALLKTLEEPPAHVIFILATTELHKIPATVLSRCQRFDFRRINPASIISRMKTVCEGEGIKADEPSLELIARLSQGGMRDALNMLEYCAGGGDEITIKKTEALLGASPTELLADVCRAIAQKDVTGALEKLDEVYRSSRDVAVFWRELIAFCRDIMLYIASRGGFTCSDAAKEASKVFNVPRIMYVLDTFIATEGDMGRSPANAKLYAEMAVIKVCNDSLDTSASALAARITDIEEKLASGEMIIRRESEPSTLREQADSLPEKNKETSTAVQDTPKPQKEENVRNWADIIRKIEQKDVSVSSFLKDTGAYVGVDGKLHIKCGSAFAVMMLSSDEKKRVIALTVSAATGKKIGADDILPEHTDVKTEREPIEDFIDTEE